MQSCTSKVYCRRSCAAAARERFTVARPTFSSTTSIMSLRIMPDGKVTPPPSRRLIEHQPPLVATRALRLVLLAWLSFGLIVLCVAGLAAYLYLFNTRAERSQWMANHESLLFALLIGLVAWALLACVYIVCVEAWKQCHLLAPFRSPSALPCARCLYDLSRANTSRHCPECGQPFNPAELVDYWRRYAKSSLFGRRLIPRSLAPHSEDSQSTRSRHSVPPLIEPASPASPPPDQSSPAPPAR